MQIRLTFLGVCVIAVLLLGGCTNLPIWTEDQESEVTRGDTIHKEILQRTHEYRAPKLTSHVQMVGKKVAAASDCPSFEWQFTVLDSPVENAFATMGGHVYITRGLLIYLRDDSDLAAILAHEVAHICRHDSIHARRRSSVAGVAALGVILAAPELLLFPSVVAAPLDMGLSAVSRSDESAADQQGATYLARAGYRPEAMREALDIILSIEAYNKVAGRASDGFWHRAYADHPATTDRQERLLTLTPAASTDSKKSSDRQFLALLEGVEVGNSSASGIVYQGKRYFPDFDITLEVPAGWRVYAWHDKTGHPSRIWLASEKREGMIIIQKFSILESNKEACTESLETLFQTTTVEEAVPLHPADIRTCTARAWRTDPGLFSKKQHKERVAVMEFDVDHYFTFRGIAYRPKEEDFNAVDRTFLAVAQSIEPLAANSKAPERPRLHIYQARSGDSFETLAKKSPLPVDNTRLLRAINLQSEKQEPGPGDTVKVVQ